MSIKHFAEKIKGLRGFRLPVLRTLPDDLFLGFIVILVAFGSFGLGRLSKIGGSKTPIRIENEPTITSETFTPQDNTNRSANIIGATTGELVGSKTGKKYHYPWCAGAQRIAEANKVYFASKADAEAQGYTPASNCKGL